MLIIPTIPFRRRRKSTPVVLAPGVPLVLVGATYNPNDEYLILTFDREINVAGIVGLNIRVDDPLFDSLAFVGTGTAEILEPAIVRIGLDPYTSPTGDGPTLTATAGNGIVAADDGGEWAGCVGVALPFS